MNNFRSRQTIPNKPVSTRCEIHRNGMDFLEDLLAPEAPDPHKDTAKLIAEEERRRLLAVIHERMTVLG